MQIAVYISDHGFGHTTRMVALIKEFQQRGLFCHVRCQRPDFLFDSLDEQLSAKHRVTMDFGIVNGEGLKPDITRTRDALISLMSHRQYIVEREVEFLRCRQIDLIIADIPFLIAEAGMYAKLPVFAISNFNWYFIYKYLFVNDKMIRPVINCIGSLYGLCDIAFRLPFSSAASMGTFRRVEKLGFLARTAEGKGEVADNLPKPHLLCTFGGIGEIEVDIGKLCSAFAGTVISRQACGSENHYQLPPETDFIDYLAGTDIILTKPGYSTFAEAVTMGKFLIYYSLSTSPENVLLDKGLQRYYYKLRLDRLNLSIGEW